MKTLMLIKKIHKRKRINSYDEGSKILRAIVKINATKPFYILVPDST